MRTEIESYVKFNGLSLPFNQYLDLWEKQARNSIKNLPFKRDLRYWNNGPTSMQPKRTVAAFVLEGGRTSICIGVFEIWERSDGFGMRVYKFDSMEDYQAYNPSNEMPDAINREIGLCKDYHKGV